MVCAPVGRGGCYQQIYTVQSGTDGGVLGKGHAGSWASCAEMVRGSWAYWWPESCSGKKLLKDKKQKTETDYPGQHIQQNRFRHNISKVVPRYECSGVERWP